MLLDGTQPLILSDDNFTALTRTPWAGERLSRSVKRRHIRGRRDSAIGEAWELSTDDDFPSLVVGSDLSLKELIAKNPSAFLSEDFVSRWGVDLRLVVKLIDSDQNLSFQVHPKPSYPGLRGRQAAKYESWYVLEAQEDAGVYLGFNQQMTPSKFRQLVDSEQDISQQLQFVPVKRGDYFNIPPGTPHALGAGVTVIEPQFVIDHSQGVTYRLWDWGRKYNELGQLDNKGQPRATHLEDGMANIDFERASGSQILQLTKQSPVKRRCGQLLVTSFPATEYYQMHVLVGSSEHCQISLDKGFGFFETLEGEFSFKTSADVDAGIGQPLFAAASAWPLRLKGSGLAVLIVSSGAVARFEELEY